MGRGWNLKGADDVIHGQKFGLQRYVFVRTLKVINLKSVHVMKCIFCHQRKIRITNTEL